MTDYESLGPQFHPHVAHYRDGGMGGIGENHSVVGFVPTESLLPYREWDRTSPEGSNADSREVIEARRQDLRSGEGFHTPLMLLYNHKEHWARLGEGNHRLAAAVAEHTPVVPLRVVRARVSPRDQQWSGGGGLRELPGAPATDTWPRRRTSTGRLEDYVPSDMHPSYIDLSSGQRKPTKEETLEELLRPDPWRV